MHLILNQGNSEDMGLDLLPRTEKCLMCTLPGELLFVLVCFHMFKILGEEKVDPTSGLESSLLSVSAYHCELPNDTIQCLILGPSSLCVEMTCISLAGFLYWLNFFNLILALPSKRVSSHLPTLLFKGFKSVNMHIVDFADMPTSSILAVLHSCSAAICVQKQTHHSLNGKESTGGYYLQ